MSFGLQWNRFPTTQLDSQNMTTISAERFEQVTGWTPGHVNGCRVLDAGCGSGRFSEVALRGGAEVTAVDLSEAAYAASANLDSGMATVVRSDLLASPLRAAWFDKVFSIGVLQHTPEPAAVAAELVRVLRPGGELSIWMYERRWYTALMPKALIRLATRRMSAGRISQLSELLVRAFTPAARASGSLPTALRRVVAGSLPIASYWGALPLSPEQQREWSLLDTHDWLSPTFDNPLNFETLRRALVGAGAVDVRRLDVPGLAVAAKREG